MHLALWFQSQVYNFLRLARMIHCIAARGVKLITTNFHDDFILVSNGALKESAKNSMELIFLFSGWDSAAEGKKATSFAEICCALGVALNLSKSPDSILEIKNTESHVSDLPQQLDAVIQKRELNHHDALKLRGRLGFAD